MGFGAGSCCIVLSHIVCFHPFSYLLCVSLCLCLSLSALSWFHVLKLIRGFILDYYDGLFQGWVLSCVFQMLLDIIAPLSELPGHKFKDMVVVFYDQAFADDISVMTSNSELNQLTINVIVRFLRWACLQANPNKCISMVMKLLCRASASKYKRYGGDQLQFIVNVAKHSQSLEYDHFQSFSYVRNLASYVISRLKR